MVNNLSNVSLRFAIACSPYLSTGLMATVIAFGIFLTSEFKALAKPSTAKSTERSAAASTEQSTETSAEQKDNRKVALMNSAGSHQTRAKNKTDERTVRVPFVVGKTTRETVTIDGRQRQYFQHIPLKYDGTKRTPVMLVFNGWGDVPGQGNTKPGAAGTEQFTGLSEKADKENFIVVYLDGYQKNEYSWNNGQWFFSKQDDFEFTNRVLDSLRERFRIDRERLYLVGYSQGASFAHRYATTFPERIAALASVGGWITGKEKKPTGSPYSCLEIHSASDPTVPVDGRVWWLKMKPQEDLKKFYRSADGIEEEAQIITKKAADGSDIKIEISRCKTTGTEFRYITVANCGHKWFGGKGAESAAINATDTIWDFVKDKRKVLKG